MSDFNLATAENTKSNQYKALCTEGNVQIKNLYL